MRPKRATIWMVVLAALIIAIILINQLTAVKPAMPAARQGDPLPRRPMASDQPFNQVALAPTFSERRSIYLQWAATQPTSSERGGIWTDIAKLEQSKGSVSTPALADALKFVDDRNDTADFTMAGLVRLYYKQVATGNLTAEQLAAIRKTMLNFKYWLDEPNPTLMELWTENHQILSHSSEYLAGQMFPDEVFTNNGQNGRWHMEHAKAMILRWIDFHARTGFAEWDSIPYYNMDLAALLNLVEFASDEQIWQKATMLVDVMMLDIGADSFYGQYATSHGRTTAAHIKSAAGDNLVTFQGIAFGLGRFTSTDMASVSLATTQRYNLPPVLQDIAWDNPPERLNFERHSIPVTDAAAAQYNLSFNKIEDFDIWWGMGAFTHPRVINLTIDIADKWQMWNYPDFKPFKDLGMTLKSLGLLPLASQLLDPDTNGNLSSEVNKVTYRTPDAQLSSAQDYRKGEKGYQQHIWQATLSPYAVVFATNPDSLREDDKNRPSFWASNGRMPRTGQVKNVLISLFNISSHAGLSIMEARHYAFSHAYFPRWAFDEVKEVPAAGGGGWIFGRKGKGYVALYSHQPYQWQTQGPDAGQEVIALGLTNAWLCQVGREAVDGSFEKFVVAVSTALLKVDGLNVTYQAPGAGALKFGWEGALTLDGKDVPLSGYKRFENPYTQVEFNTGIYNIRLGQRSLELDFANTRRIVK